MANATHHLPLLDEHRAAAPDPSTRRPPRYGRWRAATLAGVYVLFAVHIAHWRINGRTLAPLELNEVMYALELGIVTAGFIFMVAATASVAIFGRFFCSWGCHILALEDLCAWLLARIGIRPKPVRSRVLLLVPPAAMLYMFIWPQLQRIAASRPAPALHLRVDGEGWASFVTSDFWRNLPGPGVALVTFAICGFAIVYVLGSRSFCTYVCPYGAVFNLADRIAPGRIKLRANGNCTGCARCTAVCESHVRVHEEIRDHGRVVDPACLKDLDCVASCPERAITFGFTRPSLLRSVTGVARRRIRYDFTLAEEALMAVSFIAVLLTLRGLYGLVPFLLALGCAAILSYFGVVCLRLFTRDSVRLVKLQLKYKGGWTRRGRVFATAIALLAGLLIHSGFIRYHELVGDREFAQMRAHLATQPTNPPPALVASALRHAEARARWGLIHPAALDVRLGSLHSFADPPTRAVEPYDRALARRPGDHDSRMRLAEVLWRLGRIDDAETQLIRIPAEERRVGAWSMLARLQATAGDLDAAETTLREAVRRRPDAAVLHADLGGLLDHRGRADEARDHFRRAAELGARHRPHAP